MKIGKKTLRSFLLLIFCLALPPLANAQDNSQSCHDLDLEEKRLEKVMNYLTEKTGTDLISEKNNFRLIVLETTPFDASVEFIEYNELVPDSLLVKTQDLFVIRISHRLIDILTPEEQTSVIAHEIGHIANGDLSSVGLFRKIATLFVCIISLNKLGNTDFDDEDRIEKINIRTDKFAASLLKRCDIDPQVLLTALDKFYSGQIPSKRAMSLKKHILKMKKQDGISPSF